MSKARIVSTIGARMRWLDHLSIGDSVIVLLIGFRGRNMEFPGEVIRVTPRQILVRYADANLEKRFWKHSGWQLGSSECRLEQPRQEAVTP